MPARSHRSISRKKKRRKKQHSKPASATCHHHHGHYVFVCSAICQANKKCHSQAVHGLTTLKLKDSFPLSARVRKAYMSAVNNNTLQTHGTGCQSRAAARRGDTRFTQKCWVNVWDTHVSDSVGLPYSMFEWKTTGSLCVIIGLHTIRPTNNIFSITFFVLKHSLAKRVLLPSDGCSQEWVLLFSRI